MQDENVKRDKEKNWEIKRIIQEWTEKNGAVFLMGTDPFVVPASAGVLTQFAIKDILFIQKLKVGC